AARIQGQPDHQGQDRSQRGDPVGDDAVLEVDQGGGDDYQDEDDAEGDGRRGVVYEHGADAERGREPLDQRIAERNRDSAAATVAAQEQPRQQRDVVVGLDRGAAAWTV